MHTHYHSENQAIPGYRNLDTKRYTLKYEQIKVEVVIDENFVELQILNL